MTTRLTLTVAMLAAGVALLVTSAHGKRPSDGNGQRRRRPSPHAPDDVDFVDPALAYYATVVGAPARDVREVVQLPGSAGRGGHAGRPEEVVRRFMVSRDRRTYTFDLKRTFRFHTGAAVTAQSFADAFNRDANPRMRSGAMNYMREIAGADAVIEGRGARNLGSRVLAPYRLQIQLTRPLGDLTARLTMIFFCPILPNTPIDPRGIDNPAGSGPYYIAERVVNQRIVLRRNPYYRGDRPANVDQIV